MVSVFSGCFRVLYSSLRYHSHSSNERTGIMRVKILSALQDNYMFLLIDEKTQKCAAVDPVEPEKVNNEICVIIMKNDSVTLRI